MEQEDDQLSQRLQTAMFGAPVLHPDEQHRCLGTFQERIEIAIRFSEITERNYYVEMQQEFTAHPEDQLLIHGQLEDDLLQPYVKLANQANLRFVIRTDNLYHNDPDSWALILAAPTAVNRSEIDINLRYPEPLTKPAADLLTASQSPLLERIKRNRAQHTRALHGKFRSHLF